MRQLVYSLSADNDQVPFQLWWRQIALKVKKSTNILSKIAPINDKKTLIAKKYHE